MVGLFVYTSWTPSNQIQKIFITSKGSFLSLITHLAPGCQWYAFSHYKSVLPRISYHVFFCTWFPVLRMFLKLIHFFVCVHILFFLLLSSIPFYGSTTICSFTCGHLMCFQFLAIMNKPDVSISMQATV